MKKFFLALIVLAGFVSPAAAQNCDDPSGFLKSFGTIPIGDVLLLGPGCQQVQDGGAGGAVGTLPARTVVCNPTGAPALATTCPPLVARSPNLLNIDQLVTVNTNYQILCTDRLVGPEPTVAMVLTLPDASCVNQGQFLEIADLAFLVSATKTVTINPVGGQVIGTCQSFSSSWVLAAPGQSIRLYSNGANAWIRTCLNQIPFVQSVQTATNNLALTIPLGSLYAEFWLVGGGGGGAGSGTSPAAAGAGGQSCIGTSATACSAPTFVANGGAAGTTASGTAGSGGTATGCQDNLSGGIGGFSISNTGQMGGMGGASSRGGQGLGGAVATGPGAQPGLAAAAGSGSGGGGASDGTTANSGGGGAAGGTCHGFIFAPFVSLFATIGAGGSAGGTGTGGGAGSIGGSGSLVIVWHFN